MQKSSTKYLQTESNALKGPYTMIKWDLSQGCKDSSIYADQSMWYTILTNWKIKDGIIILINVEKAFLKIQHPFIYIKTNYLENWHWRNIPLHNKGHTWQIHNKLYTQWWKTENISSKIRNKTGVPTLTTIIKCSSVNQKC